MRVLCAALALSSCAGASRLELLERRIDDAYTRAVTNCQRFEEYQAARDGRVTAPCRPQDAHATVAPAPLTGGTTIGGTP